MMGSSCLLLRSVIATGWFFLLGVQLPSSVVAVINGDSMLRKLQVINQSGERVSVEWVNPKNGESIPLGAPTSGEGISLDTFVNHTFVVRTDDENATTTTTGTAPRATFKIAEDQLKQVYVIREGLAIEGPDLEAESTRSSQHGVGEITKMCQAKAVEASKNTRLSRQVILKQVTECLTSQTANILVDANEELTQERQLRLGMSVATENYTCGDPQRETSQPVELRSWINANNMQLEPVEYKVHVLHNRPSSQIHMIPNFITSEECQAIQEAAAKTLHRGTVADGKGGSRLSESRKAWQAGVPHHWHLTNEQNPIAAVSRRLFAYTEHVMGYNMTLEGQEDIMSIQYFGNGTADPTPDRYTPHCDGDCAGMPHKTGGRVATMVMYCDVPTLGGGTNFQNSNVFVKPTKHAAAFFAYLDPKTHKMETGFTSHSGCPVYEGTKRIAVQWMRVGVDKENPWDAFDTNTMKLETPRR